MKMDFCGLLRVEDIMKISTKKYEKSRHTRLDFFIPIPQIKSKINIICDIENKKFNRYNSLCCLKNINSFIF